MDEPKTRGEAAKEIVKELAEAGVVVTGRAYKEKERDDQPVTADDQFGFHYKEPTDHPRSHTRFLVETRGGWRERSGK